MNLLSPRPSRPQVVAAVMFGVLMFSGPGAHAQVISPAIPRPAVTPQESQPNTGALMFNNLVPVWQEGQPVRVKGDLMGQGVVLQPAQPVAKAQDQLLARSQAGRLLAAATLPLPPPQIGVNAPGIPATGVLPPDTVGAVGANHYIQMVNSAFAIYDKTGRLLAGPSQINSLWAGFGGPCQTDNDGDPVVRYDHLADRWLVSQFAIGQHMQCVAISKTADPIAGGWFLYAFETRDAAGQPVTPDYPKVGLWPDGYYMSTQRGFPNAGMDVWVFEREKMLAGQPARQVQFSVGAPSIVLQPSDLNGQPPPPNTPNFFIRQIDGERFGGTDRLEVFALTVNWTNPGASAFVPVTSLNVAPFDSILCEPSLGGPCVPQPTTQVRLHTLSVWPMFRAQYRNFGTHQVLLLNHSVDATGQDQAGVRWYELRRAGSGAWSVFQQGTHAPDGLHRWMGSLAMDAAGDIMLGYSVASAQTAPGIRAAHRRPTDPLGTLGAEATIRDGGGVQTHPAARWGDYGSMDVDPARPCVFWFTTLFYESTSTAGWSTRIAEIRPPDRAPNCNLLVPNLEGLQLAQVRGRLQGLGLAVGQVQTLPPATGPGTLTQPIVVAQTLPAGAEATAGATVGVTLQRLRRAQ
jgi:hypothetical protein